MAHTVYHVNCGMLINEPLLTMPPGIHPNNTDEPSARPWIHLTTTFDVEAWIDQYNRDLQQYIRKANPEGQGVCFCLEQGGLVYLHTTEGAILLDVTSKAEWVAPVISAATGVEVPRSQIWVLPDDRLTQLVLGLSSLIATSKIVVQHSYKTKKY